MIGHRLPVCGMLGGLAGRRTWIRLWLLLLMVSVPGTGVFAAESPAAESPAALAPPAATDRDILVFYDSHNEEETALLLVHQVAEMPLNHLGLRARYQDIRAPLPSADQMQGVRGLLFWFQGGPVADAETFVDWLIRVLDSGRHLVVMGGLAFLTDPATDRPIARALEQRLWNRIGLNSSEGWSDNALGKRFIKPPGDVVDFERPIQGLMQGYVHLTRRDPKATVHLAVRSTAVQKPDSESDDPIKPSDIVLAMTSEAGGYVAEGYAMFIKGKPEKRQWYINPFEFFRLAYHTDELPKLDTTTLVGRRIYYSHIDGDGWRNVTRIPRYKADQLYSSEVILKEVFRRYPGLPVSVGPVTADLDLESMGTETARRIAREIFALPHIEAASHTHSHPLQWSFFAMPYRGMEQAFLHKYPKRRKQKAESVLDLFGNTKEETQAPPDSSSAMQTYQKEVGKKTALGKKLTNHYSVPRAYYTGPYNTDKEIQGSFDLIKPLLPPGKRVEVLFWSGNTLPYPAAIKATREAGVRNLNGGDTRFDRQYNSYAWVAPLGRRIGDQQQIYCSMSNENTYTNLWTGPFYGYRHLTQTLNNTEQPIRVKPIDVYYHMYTGERLASLHALHEVLNYSEKQNIVPITASHFAAVVDGFFKAELKQEGKARWRVLNRDGMQTLRFDRATFKSVDFDHSEGVLGLQHFQGSLYVALDPAVAEPVVAITELDEADDYPQAERPYLIDSHWPIFGMEVLKNGGFEFSVQGFGLDQARWWVPQTGQYRIRWQHPSGRELEWMTQVREDHVLGVTLPMPPMQAAHLVIEPVGEAPVSKVMVPSPEAQIQADGVNSP